MNRLRTHIIRIIVLAAICTGFGLYTVQQMQADHSSKAFASWLDSIATSSDDITMQKLDDHNETTADLDEIIREASRIIKINGGDLKVAFAESTASMQLYQLLLIEWKQFQTGNAMAGIPIPASAKTFISVVLDQKGAMEFEAMASAFPQLTQQFNVVNAVVPQLFAYALQPMTEGIAIGAP